LPLSLRFGGKGDGGEGGGSLEKPRMPRTIYLALVLLLAGCSKSAASRVVVYSAQDQPFAEGIFADFTKQTGLPVAAKYDTEATKSVGLATELSLEAKRPRCDVHWNNEILGTIRLQREGIYEPYASPSAEPYPDWAKAADRPWTAFAARARVIVVNTKKVSEAERPKSLLDLADPKWKGQVAMAKPLFGTTATQAAALFEVLGPDAAADYYRKLKANDVRIVAGNKHVAEGVGRGDFALGVTDTDDALEEIEAGRPLAMIFPDRDGSPSNPRFGTLFIPNTVAVIKNCPNPEGARKLVDFLLSAEIEKRLAESASHQLPVNQQVKAKLPAGMPTPADVKPMIVDWGKAVDRWAESQRLMKDLFSR
jgi:iron(III) transport system substrate-binding protein